LAIAVSDLRSAFRWLIAWGISSAAATTSESQGRLQCREFFSFQGFPVAAMDIILEKV
jgi:hypothetical protein